MAYTAYSKTTWVDSGTPAINATNLNNIESGISNLDTKTKGYKGISTTAIACANNTEVFAAFYDEGFTYSGSASINERYVEGGKIRGITIPTGYYAGSISFSVTFPVASGDENYRIVRIYRQIAGSGSFIQVQSNTVRPAPSSGITASVTYSGIMTAGDNFKCSIAQASGETLTIPAGDIHFDAFIF